jgi:hypothetical protein
MSCSEKPNYNIVNKKIYNVKGMKGKRGIPGKPGITPHIGTNGNWFIGEKDTGISAHGVTGETPQIGVNGDWFIGGVDTGVLARGVSPSIGTNGDWYIGDKDTGVSASPTHGLTSYLSGYNSSSNTYSTGSYLDFPEGHQRLNMSFALENPTSLVLGGLTDVVRTFEFNFGVNVTKITSSPYIQMVFGGNSSSKDIRLPINSTGLSSFSLIQSTSEKNIVWFAISGGSFTLGPVGNSLTLNNQCVTAYLTVKKLN